MGVIFVVWQYLSVRECLQRCSYVTSGRFVPNLFLIVTLPDSSAYDIEPLIKFGSEGRVLVGCYLLVVAKAPRGAFMEKDLDCCPQSVSSVPMMPW